MAPGSQSGSSCSEHTHGSSSNNTISGRHDAVQKFKTRVCRNFAESGVCVYGDRCMFAHGQDELRLEQAYYPRTSHGGQFEYAGPRIILSQLETQRRRPRRVPRMVHHPYEETTMAVEEECEYNPGW